MSDHTIELNSPADYPVPEFLEALNKLYYYFYDYTDDGQQLIDAIEMYARHHREE